MSSRRPPPLTLALLWAAAALGACSSTPPPRDGADPPPPGAAEDDEVSSFEELVVASIDPPPPAPGAELRMARIELARQGGDPLGGHLAVALTGDPAAQEILVRGLGEEASCDEAAAAIALMPRQLASRPLWLALRLDCASAIARAVASVLGLEAMVDRAAQAEELPPLAEPPPSQRGASSGRCDSVEATLRAPNAAETALPPTLTQLAQGPWRLPTTSEEICDDEVLAAAIRLRRGDRTVRLALDLLLGDPEVLPEHLVTFISRFGLGAASPRIADRVDEAEGRLCAALVEAAQLDASLPVLIEDPSALPRCLLPAVRALTDRDDEQATQTLEAIAAAARHPGCEAAALAATRILVARGQRPPRWVADPTVLGRALAFTLHDDASEPLRPTAAELQELREVARQLAPREDEPPEAGPVRVLQRDLRAVLDRATGARRSALQLLLETGGR